MGKEYGTNCDVILGNILGAHFLVHFVSPNCLSKIFIPNFVHHHFWLWTLQELGYLLKFILISLIDFHASQSINIFKGFFFFGAMSHFDWLIATTILNPNLLPLNTLSHKTN
jgi:hypothetical protein